MTWPRPYFAISGRIPRLSTEEAYRTYCSACGASEGQPCTYLLTGNLQHPDSKSPRVLALRAQAGHPTKRPHNARYRHPARRLQLWLADNASILWEIQ